VGAELHIVTSGGKKIRPGVTQPQQEVLFSICVLLRRKRKTGLANFIGGQVKNL
jgi:hypothetical protein